jgi:autotransporter-associated beta strand protein
VGNGTWTVSGTNSYTGSTTVSAGTLLVDGSIASSSGVTVNAGATLGGHGVVSSIAGAGEVAPGDSPGILTAIQLDPSANMSFDFQMTQEGAPAYNNAAFSGNDLLHLTGLDPFTSSLTSGNVITIDFTGATLEAGQFYRGGFFTDVPTDTSVLADATFVYLGLDGFDIQFDGFVTELNADFASGGVFNGSVMQFDIKGAGSGSTVPEAGSSLLLLFLALVPLSVPGFFGCLKSRLNRSPR